MGYRHRETYCFSVISRLAKASELVSPEKTDRGSTQQRLVISMHRLVFVGYMMCIGLYLKKVEQTSTRTFNTVDVMYSKLQNGLAL